MSNVQQQSQPDTDCSQEESSGKPEDDDSKIPVKKPRSSSYQHFTWDENTKRYKCKYCSASYGKDKTGGTSGLVKHLKTKHPNFAESAESKAMMKFIGTDKSEKFSVELFMTKLIEFIIVEDQPFTISESESLKSLLTLCNPSINMPCRDTIRKRVHQEFEKRKDLLKKELEDAPGKISFQVDGWTSSNQFPLQGVIAQWITRCWEMRETVLSFSLLEGAHSGKNLSESFVCVLEDYNILDRVLGITCDNASNMRTFSSEFATECIKRQIVWNEADLRVRCLAHILNLSCKAAIGELMRMDAKETASLYHPTPEDLDEGDLLEDEDESAALNRIQSETKSIVGKLRRGIIKIRASPQRREIFLRQCAAAELKPKMLIRDNATRWNSTFLMLKRVLKLKKPLTCTLLGDKDLAKFNLTDSEWEKIEYIMDLLQPFKDMTLLLEKEELSMISSSVMVYIQLFRHLEKYLIDEKRKLKGINPKTGSVYPEWIRTAASKAHEKLDKYYPTSDGLVYVISTILDPRCKMQWYKSVDFPTDIINQYKKCITTYWENNYKPKPRGPEACSSNSTIEKQKDVTDLFSLQMKKPRSENKDELQLYLSEKVVAPDTMIDGPLSWWKIHELEFPNLAKMARDFLAVSGTSASMERAFSSGPDLLTHRRQSLNANTINECLCLKAWYKGERKTDLKKALRLATSSKVF